MIFLKHGLLFAVSLAGALALPAGALLAEPADKQPQPSPDGIAFPEGYTDWAVISISHRVDNNTMRVILGNDLAVKAARAGDTNPWPDGATLGKVVWKESPKDNWPKAIAPKEFVHAEFMFKDSVKYKDTAGWGWARWVGMEQKPYGKDAAVAQECMACHAPVKSRDWVFTDPALLP
jgi:hypothetical protein